MHPKSGNNKEVFVDLINDFDNILNMLKALNTKAIQWFDCWRDNNEFDATVVAESMIDDFKEHLDFYRLYHLLTEFHGKIDDIVFMLQAANKAVLAHKLTDNFAKICELSMILRDRAEDLFEANPFDNPSIETEDEEFWVYDNKKDMSEQISGFAYIMEIQAVTLEMIEFLKKISELDGLGEKNKTNRSFGWCTKDIVNWDTPLSQSQIQEIESEIDPLANNTDELIEYIETADEFIAGESSSWTSGVAFGPGDLEYDVSEHPGFSEDTLSWVLSCVLSAKKLRAELETMMGKDESKEFYRQLQVGLRLEIGDSGVHLRAPSSPIPSSKHSAIGKQLATRLKLQAKISQQAGLDTNKTSDLVSISERERKVLRYLSKEPTLKQFHADIESGTGISRKTVGKILSSLHEKGLVFKEPRGATITSRGIELSK